MRAKRAGGRLRLGGNVVDDHRAFGALDDLAVRVAGQAAATSRAALCKHDEVGELLFRTTSATFRSLPVLATLP